jgi:hypothetical protein
MFMLFVYNFRIRLPQLVLHRGQLVQPIQGPAQVEGRRRRLVHLQRGTENFFRRRSSSFRTVAVKHSSAYLYRYRNKLECLSPEVTSHLV